MSRLPLYVKVSVNPSLILLAKLTAFAAAIGRGLAADVVRSAVLC